MCGEGPVPRRRLVFSSAPPLWPKRSGVAQTVTTHHDTHGQRVAQIKEKSATKRVLGSDFSRLSKSSNRMTHCLLSSRSMVRIHQGASSRSKTPHGCHGALQHPGRCTSHHHGIKHNKTRMGALKLGRRISAPKHYLCLKQSLTSTPHNWELHKRFGF